MVVLGQEGCSDLRSASRSGEPAVRSNLTFAGSDLFQPLPVSTETFLSQVLGEGSC